MQEIFSMSRNNNSKHIKRNNKIKRLLGNVLLAVTTAIKAISARSAESRNLHLSANGNANVAQSTKANSVPNAENQNLRQKNGLANVARLIKVNSARNVASREVKKIFVAVF